jgi:lipopolysaccharide/colanic/teichoic acid biosynthesis glycosyltransferase
MRRGTPDLSTAEMQKQAQSPVTKVGAFLRRTSLDELPQ